MARRPKRTLWMTALAALLIGLVLIMPSTPARATVIPGATTPLVNVGQPIRESSTAVPIYGITATSNNPADLLTGITVTFSGTGFASGPAGTLLALTANPATSGVALYADSGAVPGALDSTDAGVTATASSWAGSTVTLTYAATFPTVTAGAFDWILVIRTSTTGIASGNQIIATIPANGITFSGTVSQPAAAVTTNTLIDSPTVVSDRLAPQTWIGPSGDPVNARAVLGVKVVDGGIPTNYGIHDQLSRLVVQFYDVFGTFGGATLAPLSANPATSGVALYRDSNGNGVWDPADAGVTLTGVPTTNCVGPAGGAALDWCLTPNAEFLPHILAAPAASYFVIVRSGVGMASGDQFQFQILQSNGLSINGVLAADAGRMAGMADVLSSSLLGDNIAPCITPGCGVPLEPQWVNPTSSPYLYLYPFARTLYFSHGMGATPVPGEVRLDAQDTESGLSSAVFGAAPSLAGSPASQSLSGNAVVPVFANYSFNATSTGASSPVPVTLFDAVGNHVTLFFRFILDTNAPTITPTPGWTNLAGTNPLGLSPLYVNATRTLWFSPWIEGTATADIRVNLFDGVSGLKNATASKEPSLAAGPEYADPTTFPAGTNTFNGWTVTYSFSASSRDTSRPADITACDNTANCATVPFDYRMDATPPVVAIVSPSSGSVVSGQVVVAARASDSGSGLAPPPMAEILGQTGFQPMMWNGTAWVFPIPTALFADGSYRIVVEAFDNVGNQGVAVTDVLFHNAVGSAPPALVFVAPGANALLSGIVTIRVSAVDPLGVANVTLIVGSSTYTMASVGNGVYEYALDTTSLTSGPVTLTVTATDAVGLSTTRTQSVQVDNTPPAITLGNPSADRGPITLTATITDPAGLSSVTFVVDGKSYVGVAQGSGVYAVTIFTSASDNGVHAYEVVAVDRAGNTATRAGTFAVNTPADYLGAAENMAPLLIFVVLATAFALALLVMFVRRRKAAQAEMKKDDPASAEAPKKPEDEL